MARRSKARQVVLQMLFQCDLNADVGPHTVRAMINEQIEDRALRTFAWDLYSGATENRNAIDARIQKVAQNWSLDRMAPTDRNVLRLCVYEMLYSDTPPPVAVDEAIDLARTFGTNQSAQFVNGLLDQLMPGARPAAPVRQETTTETGTGESSPPGQEMTGNTETAESSSGRRDPRRRMAGHNAQLTPSIPGTTAYIQQPAAPLSEKQVPETQEAPPQPASASLEDMPEEDTAAEDMAEAAVEPRPEAAPDRAQQEESPQTEMPQEVSAQEVSAQEVSPAGGSPEDSGSPQADTLQDASPELASPEDSPAEEGESQDAAQHESRRDGTRQNV